MRCCSAAGRSRPTRVEPVDRAAQAVFEADFRGPVELSLGSGDVEGAARLTVRLGGVPDELAVEAGEFRDQLGEVADGDLLAGAED